MITGNYFNAIKRFNYSGEDFLSEYCFSDKFIDSWFECVSDLFIINHACVYAWFISNFLLLVSDSSTTCSPQFLFHSISGICLIQVYKGFISGLFWLCNFQVWADRIGTVLFYFQDFFNGIYYVKIIKYSILSAWLGLQFWDGWVSAEPSRMRKYLKSIIRN